MSVKPILFSGPMVRALLDGSKTQTRRLLRRQPDPRCTEAFQGADGIWRFSRPSARAPISSAEDDMKVKYAAGDLIWVRETWASAPPYGVRYAATDDVHELRKKKPAIHMPRVVSRITLEVTSVRVERLQDISTEDAEAEGVATVHREFFNHDHATPRMVYRALWEHINGPGAWDLNPWIVAVTFKVHKQNVDAFLAAAGSKATRAESRGHQHDGDNHAG